MRPNKRDELVRKALDVFYRHGFHATGMDMLVVETGVSKTSMYKHFKTKDDLILAVLKLRDERFREWLYARIEELSNTPSGQMIAVFDALGEWFDTPDFRGCMFIKASSEFQETDNPIYQQSSEHKRLLLEHLIGLARRADLANPEQLARQLIILKEGAIIMAAMGFGDTPAQDAKAAAEVLFASSLQD
ncbi:HTH-type transcriptional regulator YjdC [Roseovarius albus]|uniref:HTH-type transcriptional regulator YjdC n=1 Tax=Roseovarius albus TaxID=1247867 RepID=A0A1X6YVP3_9RHOB|nr:TetR/AcrR family transcriptional regulator [Roseovarius albus]SLN32510.1 HTH-type transcriptional regulator YjdC [Roseovarius albus]